MLYWIITLCIRKKIRACGGRPDEKGIYMLKVVIADDEIIICEMLQKMIHWEEKGLEVAAIAANGLQVYEYMKTIRPDIIITDIRMPVYDGLQLVKKGIELGLHTDFIIMSGYKNFEYAHTALNLGVKHYLLKPIDAQEINETLDRILLERQQQDMLVQEIHEAEALARDGKQKMRKHFLNTIIADVQSPGTEQLQAQEDCGFDQGCFVSFLTKVDSEAPAPEIHSLLELLDYQIEKNMEGQGCEFITSFVSSGIMTVVNYPMEWRSRVADVLAAVLKSCQLELNKFSKYHVTIGVGQEKYSINEVRASAGEAVQAVKCRLKKGIDTIIYWNLLRYKQLSIQDILSPKYQSIMSNQAEVLDGVGFTDMVDELYKQVQGTLNYSPLILFELVDHITGLVLDVWKKNQVLPATLEEFGQNIQLLMDCNYECNMLIYTFKDTLMGYFARVRDEKNNINQLPIRMAKQYVNENYAHPITLEELSDAIGLAPTYVSTLFKKEIGINFSEYLTSCRMEAAKKLLKKKDLSINDIAEQVGYSDPKYFSKMFNKIVGLKPSAYRKLYR